MKNKILIILLVFIILSSMNVLAENGKISNQDVGLEENTIYLYGLNSCPHCQKAKEFLEKLDQENNISYKYLELSSNKNNKEKYFFQKQKLNIKINSVPLIVFNDYYWVGYSKSIKDEIKEVLKSNHLLQQNIQKNEKNDYSIFNQNFYNNQDPLLSTIVIGFIDGFNPCSLWVLTILLGFLIHSKSRKKMFLVGTTFLLTTALVYGLFIAGALKGISYINQIDGLSILLGLFVLIFGIINIKDFFFFKKGISATISNKNKSKLIKHIRSLINIKKKMPVVLLFTVLVALVAALVEIPCTSGFPVIWGNIMVSNGYSKQLSQFIPFIIIYLGVYLIDELIVFGLAIYKLRIKKMNIDTGKNLKLIMGYIMFFTGIDILLKTNYIHSFKGLVLIISSSIIAYIITKKINKY